MEAECGSQVWLRSVVIIFTWRQYHSIHLEDKRKPLKHVRQNNSSPVSIQSENQTLLNVKYIVRGPAGDKNYRKEKVKIFPGIKPACCLATFNPVQSMWKLKSFKIICIQNSNLGRSVHGNSGQFYFMPIFMLSWSSVPLKREVVKIRWKNSVRTAKKTTFYHYKDRLANAVQGNNRCLL